MQTQTKLILSKKQALFYAGCKSIMDCRMREWGVEKQPRRIQRSVRRVLSELHPSALYILKDPRLEVMVLPEGEGFSVWAYFPVHRRRWIARQLRPKPQTRVLLVINAGHEREPAKTFEDDLRDHLGHTLLYTAH
jgi:hypothetical protein